MFRRVKCPNIPATRYLLSRYTPELDKLILRLASVWFKEEVVLKSKLLLHMVLSSTIPTCIFLLYS